MRIIRILREGVRSLRANKLRTFFMMVGTIIGIAALIVVYAAGKGTEQLVMTRMRSFGLNGVMVAAGGGRGVSVSQEGITTLRLEDAEAIRAQVPSVVVAGCYALKRGVVITAGKNQYQGQVEGVETEWYDAYGWYASEGEQITADDIATMARVAVIGQTLKRQLFPDSNPVGQYIEINNTRFLIKGVLQARGLHVTGADYDAWLTVPISTFLRRMYNWDHLTNIRIRVRSEADILPASEQIRQLLHERHHITPPEEDDFAVWNTIDVAKAAAGIWGTLNILLKSLTGLVLLVGGVVLMNILLISVGERKHEIGLRRALGADRRDIFMQFLAESWMVTFLGMLGGELLGAAATLVLIHGLKLDLILSYEPFVLGAVFAFIVGTIFGMQPALRASKLHPVEALRAK